MQAMEKKQQKKRKNKKQKPPYQQPNKNNNQTNRQNTQLTETVVNHNVKFKKVCYAAVVGLCGRLLHDCTTKFHAW